MISERMQLPSDVAGITLLAFANGAPDIFTELAAITSGDHVDMARLLSLASPSPSCLSKLS
jgi:Ca2+/Na+ antiporter